MPDATNAPKPTDDGDGEWSCPYCDHRDESLLEVRTHISQTNDTEHEGKNGWSLSDDIRKLDADGNVVDVVPGADLDDPPSPLEEYQKKTLIINAWGARGGAGDPGMLSDVIGCTEQYARDVIGDIETSEISARERQEVLDGELMEWLDDRIDAYYENPSDFSTPEPTEERASDTDKQTTLEEAQHTAMSTDDTDADTTDEQTTNTGQSEDGELPGTMKDQLIATWILGVGPDLTNKQGAELVGSSEEYARQVFNSLAGKEGYDKVTEQDKQEVSDDDELVDAVAKRLYEEDLATAADIEADVRTPDSIEDTTTASTSSAASADTTATAKATPTTTTSSAAGGVEAEVQELIGVMDVLEREAESSGDGGRAFVAREAKERAQNILEKLDS